MAVSLGNSYGAGGLCRHDPTLAAASHPMIVSMHAQCKQHAVSSKLSRSLLGMTLTDWQDIDVSAVNQVCDAVRFAV